MIVTGKIGNTEFNGVNVGDVETLARLGLTSEQVEELKRQTRADIARRRCATHIERHYPTYKQLNLMRSGTKAEKDKMDTFINACRDWSKSQNPDPAALEAIQP